MSRAAQTERRLFSRHDPGREDGFAILGLARRCVRRHPIPISAGSRPLAPLGLEHDRDLRARLAQGSILIAFFASGEVRSAAGMIRGGSRTWQRARRGRRAPSDCPGSRARSRTARNDMGSARASQQISEDHVGCASALGASAAQPKRAMRRVEHTFCDDHVALASAYFLSSATTSTAIDRLNKHSIWGLRSRGACRCRPANLQHLPPYNRPAAASVRKNHPRFQPVA